jgi:transcriptional regulator with XRE-family HTH domain
MSKREQKIKITNESKTLKKLRLKANLSVRILAEKMQLSKSRVHQMEQGRGEITPSYVSKFLEATLFSETEWIKLAPPKSITDHKADCILIIQSLPKSKLRAALNYLELLKAKV